MGGTTSPVFGRTNVEFISGMSSVLLQNSEIYLYKTNSGKQKMDTPIKSFCDQVSINGQLNLQKCGINANNLFFYNYLVAPTPTENNCLLTEMSKHPVLSLLTNRTIVTREDVTPFYPPAPQAGYPPQAAGYSHGYATPHAGFGVPAYPSAVSNPAPHAGFGVPAYPSAVSNPAPHAGFGGPTYPTLIPTPATGSRFFASSSAGIFSTTPGAVSGTGSTYTGSPVAFTPFSSVSTTTPRSSYATSTSTPAGYEKVLPDGVTLVTCNKGVLEYAKHNNREKRYGIVSSVDLAMQLNAGVAKAIKDKFSNDYFRVSGQNLIAPGECFTYNCQQSDKTFAPDLTNCQTIHNVLIPSSDDKDFQETLKNTFVNLFEEAARKGVDLVFCPLLGCGRAGGTGKALAKAVSEAKTDFEKTGKRAPELILVGMSSIDKDKTACVDFESKWNELGHGTSSTHPPVSGFKNPYARASTVAAANTATTGAGSGYNTSRVLIRDQLEVVMNSDKGMFGYAKLLSSQGKAFDLVNAANGHMQHGAGIAKQFSQDLGHQFDQDTQRQAPFTAGSCYTTQSYGYAWDPKFGLRNCHNIHNVVAPNVIDYYEPVPGSGGQKQQFNSQKYHDDFTNAFVSLLLEAYKKGSNSIVSCFIGCSIFGGTGKGMAHALHAAYQDSRITSLPRVPRLILVGWKDGDVKVHNEFIQTFDSLNTANKVRLPSGIAPARPLSTGISGTTLPTGSGAIRKTQPSYSPSGADLSSRPKPASTVSTLAVSSKPLSTAETASHSSDTFGFERMGLGRTGRKDTDFDDISSSSTEKKYSVTSGVYKSTESAATAFKGGGKTIDCGICGESKPEKDFQQVKGLEVCSDCSKGYQSQGISLSEAAKLGEEYTAINYKPLRVSRDRRDLPGYPGAGRIIVRIEATAPNRLSDGRMLDFTHKNETHYLPDNDLGKELLRLLEVLHQEKLIYKIDKSNTTGKFAITFNFHLKTSDSGGERSHGYPDKSYPSRALNEIMGLASTHSLQDKLDTSKLVNLLFV